MSETKFTPPEAQINDGDKQILDELNSQKTIDFIIKIAHSINHQISKADADDVSQEVILKANQAIKNGKFKHEEKLNAWIYTITRNLIFSNLQKQSVKRRKGLVDEIPEGVEPQDTQPNSREILELKLKNQKLQKLLNELKPDHRAVLELHLQGYSQKEIGEKLGMPPSTAGTRTYYAKKHLFEILEREKQEEDK